jgi:iron complex outermembrane receptor protein
MRKVFLFAIQYVWFFPFAFSQELPDSTLQEITIQAYAADRPSTEVPVSVAYLNTENLERYSNTSILPAINTIPGARMEERSPGSYRFSIRGSSIRSPFGVRNVKMYWNGLPLTDAGGNTYLNVLDFNSVGSIEVIKGPGGSLYGAGTGGVVLLNSPQILDDRIQVSALTGSFGLYRLQGACQIHGTNLNSRVQIAHQQSNGYREQTAMKRSALTNDVTFRLGKGNILSSSVFYTDLFYETPGGLTQSQYNANPQQARPATAVMPGAVEQHAAVRNKTFFGGINHEYQWNNQWTTKTGVYGSLTDFNNPTIRNYEIRNERNVGLRTVTQYGFQHSKGNVNVNAGLEVQRGSSPIDVFENNEGKKGIGITQDHLSSQMALLFAQADIEFENGLFLTLAGSVNHFGVEFERRAPIVINEKKKFDLTFLPRIALLKKLNKNLSVYGSWSKGFSPPTISELYPSRGIFETNLKAEQGYNVELGIKGELISNKLSLDLTVYDFRLHETIVIRRDTTAGNPEYFINAGRTSQQGLEAFVSWNAFRNQDRFISMLRIWCSYAYSGYRFRDYVQDVNDFSGNRITGIPPTVVNMGVDAMMREKFYLAITANYTDHIPLNDANTDFSNEYFLLQARAGYKVILRSGHFLDFFAGVDNALNQRYSLGNDLNAIGGRYFNAAAPRNYFCGIKIDLSLSQ